MKKFLYPLLLLNTLSLSALSIGSPVESKLLSQGILIPDASYLSLQVGYEGDFLLNGKMQQSGGSYVDAFSQTTNSALASFNILQAFSFSAGVGVSRLEARWRFTDSLAQIQLMDLQTEDDLLWSFRGKWLVWSSSPLAVALGGGYSRASYSLESLRENGASTSSQGSIFFQQAQVNLGLSYTVDFLTPYLGVFYSHVWTHLKNFSQEIGRDGATSQRLSNRIPAGLFLGCTLSTGHAFWIQIEGRLIAEESATLSGVLQF